MHAQSPSCVRLFATPWTAAHQAYLTMDFPGKNTGICCHFLLQGIFHTQGLNPHLLPWQVGLFFFLNTEPPGKPQIYIYVSIYLYISHFKSDFLNTNDRKPIINNILLYRISTKVPCVHSVETYKESVFFP